MAGHKSGSLLVRKVNFSKDRKIVREFFTKYTKQFGDHVHSLAWESEYTQNARFSVLSAIAPLMNQSVLDVGCGKADLYAYLCDQQIEVEYFGVDLTRELLDIAGEKFPDIQLFYRDFLEDKYYPDVDYTLSSGIANVRTPNNQEYLEAVIRKMFSLARKGSAVNMLSSLSRSRYKDPGVYFYSPEKMLNFALMLTPHVILRHDYLPNDFTLYLYKAT